MKYLVLLFFISMGYSHPESNMTYPVFFFNGYEVDGPTFDITDIGADHNHALECRTDLDTCCSNMQGFHRGNWYSPNGQQLEVDTSGDRNSMYQSRLDSKVNLYRGGDFGIREGKYCCKIETVAVHRNEKRDDYHVETKCIKLVNYTKGRLVIRSLA